MQKLIVKLFIKDYQNVNDPKVRTKYGTTASIIGIISNAILCLIKIILGILSASLAIIADGINNLTDVFSSFFSLFGFKIASSPADKKHPFGHERFEYIIGLIISFLILIIGFNIGKEAIMKLISNDFLFDVSFYTIIIMVISIIIKIWQALFYYKMAKAINSKALYASFKDSLIDSISTSTIILGLIIVKFTNWYQIDGILGIIVALFILINGIKLTIETSSLLIGTKPSKDETNKIIQTILSYEKIIGLHDLIVHHYGQTTTFATVHVELPSSTSLVEAHNYIDEIERNFINNYNINLTIHIDPIEINNPKTDELKKMVNAIIQDLSPNLSFHDFRVIYTNTYTKILFDLVVPNKFCYNKTDLTNIITTEINKIDPSYQVVMQIEQAYIE